MKVFKRILALALCAGMLATAGCAAKPAEPTTESAPTESTEKPETDSGVAAPEVAAKPSALTDEEKLTLYKTVAECETDWLLSLQLENGALPMTCGENGSFSVNPYFADFAAMALLGGEERHIEGARRYMDWHFAHLNTAETDYNGVDGTIYDYTATVSGGTLVSEAVTYNGSGKPQYDSVDSYAATFLGVLTKYYEVTQDADYLLAHREEIIRIFRVIPADMDDGLTWAKPDYRIKYFMDNCEVYEGLAAAEKLFAAALQDEVLAAEAAGMKQQVTEKMEALMWREAGYYEAAVGEDGRSAFRFDWSNFYPCATAQLLAISCGLLQPDDPRAIGLYNSFNEYFSTGENQATWERISIPDPFYWGSIPYAAAMMGDEGRVEEYMTIYQKAMRSHAYPLYNADAARVCLAAQWMLAQIEQGGE